METLGVIPARGGSSRVPGKNMRDIGGRPLVGWTIEAAKASNLSRVVVSTEDVEIAKYAIGLGVQVIPQPLESALAGDYTAPVVLSALDFLLDTEGYEPGYVCLLHPTSPFRNANHINAALSAARDSGGSVISVTNDELNGAIYVSDVARFRVAGSFFAGPIWPFVMDERSGLDINNWDDLERARKLTKGRTEAA